MKTEIKEKIEMIRKGEVPEGYKKTKVGIIPEKWDVKRLGALCEINPQKEILDDNKYVSFLGMADVSNDAKVISYQKKLYKKVSRGYTAFKDKDILVAKITPCFENGKGAIVSNMINGVGFGSTEFHVLRPKKNEDRNLIFYHTITDKFRKMGKKNMTGTAGQKRVPVDFLRSYYIQYPSDSIERQKIAQILSTWDEAIELKEKLIKGKKQQKKGLMQNLLTGKVRLPGFEGEWEEVRLKNIGTLKSGDGFPKSYQGRNKGHYPFFKVSDMNLKENATYMRKANNYINESAKDKINASVIPKNSIIFAKVGAALLLERKRILKMDSCIDNNMMALTVNFLRSDYLFIYYSLLNTRFSKFRNVGALPSLNIKDVYSVKLRIPESIQEQKAIADVLSTADREIELLKAEVELLKEQKKGLMQLLLTGIVRVEC